MEVGWGEKDYRGGDCGEVTFSKFICSSQMESTYSEVWEARRFPLGLQCPVALCVLCYKNLDSSRMEKP